MRRAEEVERAVFVTLGDYVDRGPGSRQVVERMMRMQEEPALLGGMEQVFLMGNHDLWFTGWLHDGLTHAKWLQSGGETTCASYGVKVRRKLGRYGWTDLYDAWHKMRRAVPGEHIRWLQARPMRWSAGDYLFCHAGVDTTKGPDDQDDDTALWGADLNRRTPPKGYPGTVVHGHFPDRKVRWGPRSISLDTSITGHIAVLRLEGREKRLL